MENVKKILNDHDIKYTPIRADVFVLLHRKGIALSQPELEKIFTEYNRVTLYRTLQTFEKKGLIHRVMDQKGRIKYSICSQTCDHSKLHDQHLHFSCQSCEITVCLEKLKIPPPELPKGYRLQNFYTLATGLCPSCAS